MEDKFQCIHPDPKKTGPRISAAKYSLVRSQLLEIIPQDAAGLPFSELAPRLTQILGPEKITWLGSVSWYATTVKLDLEARGLIERVPGSQPQRLRKATI